MSKIEIINGNKYIVEGLDGFKTYYRIIEKKEDKVVNEPIKKKKKVKEEKIEIPIIENEEIDINKNNEGGSE